MTLYEARILLMDFISRDFFLAAAFFLITPVLAALSIAP